MHFEKESVGQTVTVQPAHLSSPALSTEAVWCLQVEFYFSDSNAPRDKFLLQQIQADPEVRAALQPQRLSSTAGRRFLFERSPSCVGDLKTLLLRTGLRGSRSHMQILADASNPISWSTVRQPLHHW